MTCRILPGFLTCVSSVKPAHLKPEVVKPQEPQVVQHLNIHSRIPLSCEPPTVFRSRGIGCRNPGGRGLPESPTPGSPESSFVACHLLTECNLESHARTSGQTGPRFMQLTRAADYGVRVMIHMAGLDTGARVRLAGLAHAAEASPALPPKV